MLYIINKYSYDSDHFVQFNVNGVDKVDIFSNQTFKLTGYTLGPNLQHIVEEFKINYGRINSKDLGITIILSNFARYYNRNRYHIFISEFFLIDEISLIENLCDKKTKNTFKLPEYLGLHPEYGIMANYNNFHKNSITYAQFLQMLVFMRDNMCVPSSFVDALSPFHIRIVESFYSFIAMSRDKKTILECQMFSEKNLLLDYRMEKIERVTDDNNAYYWFSVPTSSIWFVNHTNK